MVSVHAMYTHEFMVEIKSSQYITKSKPGSIPPTFS